MATTTAERRHPNHELDPATLRLFEAERERRTASMVVQERRAELVLAIAFLAAATAAALTLPSDTAFSLPVAIVSVAAFTCVFRVEFHAGAGWGTPTQLIFVPMLFLLPAPIVPLLVAGAGILSRLPEYLRREVHWDRVPLALTDCWYTLGPAVVLSLTGAAAFAWSDWPIYIAALASLFSVDFLVALIRSRWLELDFSHHLRELSAVYLVDALLAPIGLLAAFAAQSETYTFLLVLPLVALLALFAQERTGRIENALSLSRAYRGTALLLGELLTAGDAYTGDHSRRVVVLSQDVGRQLGLNEGELRDLEFAALLHDVGKLAIPKEILNKPGPLTSDEFDVMKRHVEEGQLMLDRIGGVLGDAGNVVRTHHERFDGSGYPDGLAREEIPLGARIIACCDAFNAMTTDRPYRDAMSLSEAVAELRANAGKQFDPLVVETFCATIERNANGHRNIG